MGVVLVLMVIGAIIGLDIAFNTKKESVLPDEKGASEDFSIEAQSKIEQLNEYDNSAPVEYETTLSGTITRQVVEGGKFSLRIVVEQPISSDGICRLSIFSGETERYSNVVLLSANSTYYSCAFDVSLDDFSNGAYDFKVDLETESQRGNLNGGFVYE